MKQESAGCEFRYQPGKDVACMFRVSPAAPHPSIHRAPPPEVASFGLFRKQWLSGNSPWTIRGGTFGLPREAPSATPMAEGLESDEAEGPQAGQTHIRPSARGVGGPGNLGDGEGPVDGGQAADDEVRGHLTGSEPAAVFMLGEKNSLHKDLPYLGRTNGEGPCAIQPASPPKLLPVIPGTHE